MFENSKRKTQNGKRTNCHHRGTEGGEEGWQGRTVDEKETQMDAEWRAAVRS
jgi:hypothetical protein